MKIFKCGDLHSSSIRPSAFLMLSSPVTLHVLSGKTFWFRNDQNDYFSLKSTLFGVSVFLANLVQSQIPPHLLSWISIVILSLFRTQILAKKRDTTMIKLTVSIEMAICRDFLYWELTCSSLYFH